MLAVAVATKATAVAAVVVVADMAAALAAKAPVAVAVAVAVAAVVAADVDAAAPVATADRLGVKRCRSQHKGLLGALFLRPQKQRQQRIGAHLAAPVAVNCRVKGGANG